MRINLVGVFSNLNVSRMSARYRLSWRDSKVSDSVHSFSQRLCTRSSASISFFNHGFQAELFVSRIGRIRDVYIGIITFAERFVKHLRTMLYHCSFIVLHASLKLTYKDLCQYSHAIAPTLSTPVQELILSNIHFTHELFASGTCYPLNYISFTTQTNSSQTVKRWCMVFPHQQ